ncbi:hypothetical protein INS49_014292 [Diaporthe citri]|uniref:uncharacterized protein n=1 Tax=Diaporthe citri TaxID=83186 RepID=UPI001C7F05C4|nr:uncharacterized protein INS49_014292 [Diaporthe citri]KAG6358408.1 hypothetical protein INS49_014292 [Diaporthe citri]
MATRLKPGQLVFFHPYIIGRDDPGTKYVSGFMEVSNEGSKKLSRGEWRDSTLGEYAKLPLENCYPLDEKRLLGIDIKAGETVIIAPATGRYGSGAVHSALALGARVIAIGRNAGVLEQLATIHPECLSTVRITGDADEDTEALRRTAGPRWRGCVLGHVSRRGWGIDALYDLSPCVEARALTIKGTWMCTRAQTRKLLRLVETGLLPLGQRAGMGPVRNFGLDQWKQALDAAGEMIGHGEIVITP